MKSADCFCSNPAHRQNDNAHRLTEWQTNGHGRIASAFAAVIIRCAVYKCGYKCTWLWTVDACALVYVVVEPALIRAPQNTAVTRGSEVTFKCTSDAATNKSFITWFNTLCETYTVSRDCTRVYNGYNTLDTPPRHTVTSVNNSTHVTRDLSISETKLTDAGVFVCVENIPGHGVQQISSAQLIVVGN